MAQWRRREMLAAWLIAVFLVTWAAAPALAANEAAQATAADPLDGVTELIATGRASEARAKLQGILDLYRQQGDRQGEAYGLFFLGVVDGAEGDLAAAASNLERSAAAFEAQADRFGGWAVLQSLAELEVSQAKLDAAIATHRRALALLGEAEASTQPFSAASFQHISKIFGLPLGSAELVVAQPEVFKPLLLRMAEEMSRSSLSEILVNAGRFTEAEAELSRAEELSRLLGGMFDAALAVQRGKLRRRQWRLDEARNSYRQALEAMASSPAERRNDLSELEALGELEEIDLLSGRVDAALLWNDQALVLARRRGDQILEISALQRRGKLLLDGVRFRAAEEVFTRALEMAQKAGHILLQGLIRQDLGYLALQEKTFWRCGCSARSCGQSAPCVRRPPGRSGGLEPPCDCLFFSRIH